MDHELQTKTDDRTETNGTLFEDAPHVAPPPHRTQDVVVLELLESGLTINTADLQNLPWGHPHRVSYLPSVISQVRKRIGHDRVLTLGGGSYRLATEVAGPFRHEVVTEPRAVPFEVLQHHVANPDDADQILRTFRQYCQQFGFKKVPMTPDWARQVLKLDRNLAEDDPGVLRQNRNVRREREEHFERQFRNGTMYYTNVGIGIDRNGMLCDGKARLTACVRTGKPFEVDVTFDLPEETFAVVDSPISARTNRDIAVMAGFGSQANIQVAIATVSHLYKKDHDMYPTERLGQFQLIDALKTYDVKDSVRLAVTIYREIKGVKSIMGMVHYLCARTNRAQADTFFTLLATGSNLEPGSPILYARSRITKAYGSPQNEFRGSTGEKRLRMLLVRAFKDFSAGRKATKYLLDGTGEDDWPDK